MRVVIVGSTNPVKIAAVRAVVERVWPDCTVRGFAARSGEPDQPIGDASTQRGARARAQHALDACADAELAVGVEGGVVVESDGTMRTCAWAVAMDRTGESGLGGSLAMPLPACVAERIRRGEELGPAMDAETASQDTKYGRGAVGILTAGLIDRQRAYEPLITYALVPWLSPDFFTSSGR